MAQATFLEKGVKLIETEKQKRGNINVYQVYRKDTIKSFVKRKYFFDSLNYRNFTRLSEDHFVDTIVEQDLKMILYSNIIGYFNQDGLMKDGNSYTEIYRSWESDSIVNLFTESFLFSSTVDSILFFQNNKPYTGRLFLYRNEGRGLIEKTTNNIVYDFTRYNDIWLENRERAEIFFEEGRISKLINYNHYWNGDDTYKTSEEFQNHLVNGLFTGTCNHHKGDYFTMQIKNGQTIGKKSERIEDELYLQTFDRNWKAIDTAFFYIANKLKEMWIMDSTGKKQRIFGYENNKVNLEVFYNDSTEDASYTLFYPNGATKLVGTTDYDPRHFNHIHLPDAKIKYIYYLSENGDTLYNIAHSKILYFGANGKKYFECDVKNGFLNGIFKEYDQRGKLIVYGNYRNGVKDGLWYFGSLSKINFLDKKIYGKQVYDNERRYPFLQYIEIFSMQNGKLKDRDVYRVKGR